MTAESSALRNRNYLIYLVGNTVSLHGLWIYRVALGWFAWELTASEFWVGAVAFTQFFPVVLFGPVFGVMADRFDRRAASLLINTMSTMNMLLLALLTVVDAVDIYVLCILSFMQGVLDGAHMPVRMSLVPNLVPRAQLESAIATSSISFNLSRFFGPALAGIIIALFGVGTAFAINGVSYGAILTALLLVRLEPSARREPRQADVGSALMDGIRYVAGHGEIMFLLAIIGISAVFGRGTLEMLPAFADDVFGRGSVGLAILTSGVGAGAIAAGIILARSTHWLQFRAVAAGVAVAGVLIVALALADEFWFGVVLAGLLGFLLSLCGVGTQILLQSILEDEIRGRVSSLWGMVAFGGVAVGGLVIGSVSTYLGLEPTTAAAGVCCAILALTLAMRPGARES